MPTGNDYSRVDFSNRGNTADYKDRQSEGRTGEFTQYREDLATPPNDRNQGSSSDVYPFDYGTQADNSMFSSDKADTPEAMARETAGSQSNFAELQQYLNGSLDTAGCRVAHDQTKPWEPPMEKENKLRYS